MQNRGNMSEMSKNSPSGSQDGQQGVGPVKGCKDKPFLSKIILWKLEERNKAMNQDTIHHTEAQISILINKKMFISLILAHEPTWYCLALVLVLV